MSCVNHLRILFTSYPTRSTLSYLTYILFNGASARLQNSILYDHGVASTFSLLDSSARLQILKPEDKK